MKSSNEGNMSALFCHDLLRHIRRGSVWDGIVNVEEVQFLVKDHVYHGAAERTFIRREIEQRVCGDLYFVIIYIGVEGVQSDGLLVGDKMYQVPFVSQGFAQFRRQYTTTSVGRVAYNSMRIREWI